MKKIVLKKLEIENFKGIKKLEIDFGHRTTISGQNATGKTSIVDSFQWLLFGKDSQGREKFAIRPLDEKGNPIHFVEIGVKAILDVDGKEVELHKVSKEIWRKKRGEENQTFSGNEVIYEVDGYPKKESDYKSYIAELVDEDLFKMITNPMYFTSLKWQEQRNVLMKLVTEVSDRDIALSDPQFAPLVTEIEKAPSLDDIKAKYSKSANELKKKQTEIPVRIDEAEKSKVEIDTAALELQKNALTEKVAEIDSKLENISKLYESYQKATEGIMDLKFAMSDLERKANESVTLAEYENRQKIRKVSNQITSIERETDDTASAINRLQKSINSEEEKRKKLGEEWKTAKDLVFDESSLVCRFCGQEYPTEKKDALRAEFESHKEAQITSIVKEGTDCKQNIENCTKLVAEKEAEISKRSTELQTLRTQLSELESKEFKPVDVKGTFEYMNLAKQLSEKETLMANGFSADSERDNLKSEKSAFQSELDAVNRKLASVQMNNQIDDRIAELQEEQKSVGQRLADVEKVLYLLEQFIKAKMDRISSVINEKFGTVNWKLFDVQINGGIKECCECTVNGVPFSTLNNGHKIVAGLDIINTLSQIYGVEAVVVIDNAESVNDYNLPSMDAQLVLLKVSEDKKMVVA